MEKGFISISRAITNHWIYGNKSHFFHWVDMLIYASYEDNVIIFDGKPVNVGRGEFVGSTRFLAHRWKVCKQTVQEFVKLLEADGMISRRKDGRNTIYRIINYDKYQLGGDSQISQSVGRKLGQTKELNKKIKKTSILSREEDLIFFENLFSDSQFFCDTAKLFNTSVENLREHAEKFRDIHIAKRHFHHDEDDYRKHFFNWVKIELEKQAAAPKTSNSVINESKYKARRGSDVGNKTSTTDDSAF